MKKAKDLQKAFKSEVIDLTPMNGTAVSDEKRTELLGRTIVGLKAVNKGFFFVANSGFFETPGNEGRSSFPLRFGLVELDSNGDKVDNSVITKRQLTSSRESIIEAGLLGKTDEELIEALEGHIIEIQSREIKKDADGAIVLDRYQNPVEVISWIVVE